VRIGEEMNSKIVDTNPREAMLEIGMSLGMYRKGTLVFDGLYRFLSVKRMAKAGTVSLSRTQHSVRAGC
jgi:hypothetical protein